MAALVSLKPSSTGCAAHRHDAASCDAIPPSLTPVWIAGHCIKRLGKQDVLKANVQDLTTQILNFIGERGVSLRITGGLLVGITKLYNKQVEYFSSDCCDVLKRMTKLADDDNALGSSSAIICGFSSKKKNPRLKLKVVAVKPYRRALSRNHAALFRHLASIPEDDDSFDVPNLQALSETREMQMLPQASQQSRLTSLADVSVRRLCEGILPQACHSDSRASEQNERPPDAEVDNPSSSNIQKPSEGAIGHEAFGNARQNVETSSELLRVEDVSYGYAPSETACVSSATMHHANSGRSDQVAGADDVLMRDSNVLHFSRVRCHEEGGWLLDTMAPLDLLGGTQDIKLSDLGVAVTSLDACADSGAEDARRADSDHKETQFTGENVAGQNTVSVFGPIERLRGTGRASWETETNNLLASYPGHTRRDTQAVLLSMTARRDCVLSMSSDHSEKSFSMPYDNLSDQRCSVNSNFPVHQSPFSNLPLSPSSQGYRFSIASLSEIPKSVTMLPSLGTPSSEYFREYNQRFLSPELVASPRTSHDIDAEEDTIVIPVSDCEDEQCSTSVSDEQCLKTQPLPARHVYIRRNALSKRQCIRDDATVLDSSLLQEWHTSSSQLLRIIAPQAFSRLQNTTQPVSHARRLNNLLLNAFKVQGVFHTSAQSSNKRWCRSPSAVEHYDEKQTIVVFPQDNQSSGQHTVEAPKLPATAVSLEAERNISSVGFSHRSTPQNAVLEFTTPSVSENRSVCASNCSVTTPVLSTVARADTTVLSYDMTLYDVLHGEDASGQKEKVQEQSVIERTPLKTPFWKLRQRQRAGILRRYQKKAQILKNNVGYSPSLSGSYVASESTDVCTAITSSGDDGQCSDHCYFSNRTPSTLRLTPSVVGTVDHLSEAPSDVSCNAQRRLDEATLTPLRPPGASLHSATLNNTLEKLSALGFGVPILPAFQFHHAPPRIKSALEHEVGFSRRTVRMLEFLSWRLTKPSDTFPCPASQPFNTSFDHADELDQRHTCESQRISLRPSTSQNGDKDIPFPAVSFQRLVENESREVAAAAFFELLALRTRLFIDVYQHVDKRTAASSDDDICKGDILISHGKRYVDLLQ